MQPETDPNTFTQKDLMQHLLHASQHTVTREEMAAQFIQAEVINKERFEQAIKQNKESFEQLEKQIEQSEKHNNQRFEQSNQRFEQAEKQNNLRFEQAEKLNSQRFEQSNQRFEQAEKHNNQRFDQVDIRFNKLTEEIQGQGKKHDRLTWALFAGMLAIFFKDYIVKLFAA